MELIDNNLRCYMKRNFFLLRMKVNGIKNIENEIQIDFYKSTLTRMLNTSYSHVKAIYGANGAGKTAIIYAVEIYKNLVLDSDYLAMNNANGALENLINQKNNEFEIEMYYAFLENGNELKKVYRHKFILRKKEDRYFISEEYLSELLGMQLNNESKYATLYSIKDGVIVEINKNCDQEKIKNNSMNLLTKQSFCSIFFVNAFKNNIHFGEELVSAIQANFVFAVRITVLLQASDKNYIDFYSVQSQLMAISDQQKRLSSDTFFNLLRGNRILNTQTESVQKKDFEKFKTYVDNLSLFIKVFKDDLEKIEIKKEENGNKYECELILIYKDGKRVNKKFESTGIKKLIQIYSALCSVENGGIVFIDEFDANIHDVLLVKLVEYVMNYAEGQLVFTTHNLAPMDALQKAKHSIDFLSPDSHITSWTKNGNYTAASLYRKGLIEYSPFNIEPFSFIGTFGDKK